MTILDEILMDYGEITLIPYTCGECDLPKLFLEVTDERGILLCPGDNGECGRPLYSDSETTVYKKKKIKVVADFDDGISIPIKKVKHETQKGI